MIPAQHWTSKITAVPLVVTVKISEERQRDSGPNGTLLPRDHVTYRVKFGPALLIALEGFPDNRELVDVVALHHICDQKVRTVLAGPWSGATDVFLNEVFDDACELELVLRYEFTMSILPVYHGTLLYVPLKRRCEHAAG